MPASTDGSRSRALGARVSVGLDGEEARSRQVEMKRLRVWFDVRSKEARRYIVAGHVVLPYLKNHRSMLRRS
jgi:hypothetical protein